MLLNGRNEYRKMVGETALSHLLQLNLTALRVYGGAKMNLPLPHPAHESEGTFDGQTSDNPRRLVSYDGVPLRIPSPSPGLRVDSLEGCATSSDKTVKRRASRAQSGNESDQRERSMQTASISAVKRDWQAGLLNWMRNQTTLRNRTTHHLWRDPAAAEPITPPSPPAESSKEGHIRKNPTQFFGTLPHAPFTKEGLLDLLMLLFPISLSLSLSLSLWRDGFFNLHFWAELTSRISMKEMVDVLTTSMFEEHKWEENDKVFTNRFDFRTFQNNGTSNYDFRSKKCLSRRNYEVAVSHRKVEDAVVSCGIYRRMIQFDLGSNVKVSQQRNCMILDLRFVDIGSKTQKQTHELKRALKELGGRVFECKRVSDFGQNKHVPLKVERILFRKARDIKVVGPPKRDAQFRKTHRYPSLQSEYRLFMINRASFESPAENLHCRTMPLVGGFSRGSPVSPRPFIPALLHTHRTYPSSALNRSPLKSRPNLFSYGLYETNSPCEASLDRQRLDRDGEKRCGVFLRNTDLAHLYQRLCRRVEQTRQSIRGARSKVGSPREIQLLPSRSLGPRHPQQSPILKWAPGFRRRKTPPSAAAGPAGNVIIRAGETIPPNEMRCDPRRGAARRRTKEYCDHVDPLPTATTNETPSKELCLDVTRRSLQRFRRIHATSDLSLDMNHTFRDEVSEKESALKNTYIVQQRNPKGGGKREGPEKTHRPAATSVTFPTSKNPGDPAGNRTLFDFLQVYRQVSSRGSNLTFIKLLHWVRTDCALDSGKVQLSRDIKNERLSAGETFVQIAAPTP
ncbi:hypothetical protein PR048_001276 [Dryococelus australis]|uniref:Uncharacterized protein n=1 Tax=Dryococelus australis TaxID=614101 RepID=A0ABQ9IGX3_9NEOP|nr:hypothetical protein PR048_001276 [Dryococelus australis]